MSLTPSGLTRQLYIDPGSCISNDLLSSATLFIYFAMVREGHEEKNILLDKKWRDGNASLSSFKDVLSLVLIWKTIM